METLGGFLALRLGALGEAELRLRGALELTPRPPARLAGWSSGAARGRADRARETWTRPSACCRTRRLSRGRWTQLSTLALAARAELRLAQGSEPEALADLVRIGELQRDTGGEAADGGAPAGARTLRWP